MSRIVVGHIEPITAKKLMTGLSQRAEAAKRRHAPTLDQPDYDHPLVKTLLEQMPKMTYHGLEAVKAHLEKHDGRSMTNARAVDGMLRLVNAELLRRDGEREIADLSFIDLLTKKGIIQ